MLTPKSGWPSWSGYFEAGGFPSKLMQHSADPAQGALQTKSRRRQELNKATGAIAVYHVCQCEML